MEMLIVRKSQMDSFQSLAITMFIKKTKEFIYHELGEERRFVNDKVCDEYIRGMIQFAQSYNIESELNIQKLIFINLKYNLVIPVEEIVLKILEIPDRDEDFKIKRIYELYSGLKETN